MSVPRATQTSTFFSEYATILQTLPRNQVRDQQILKLLVKHSACQPIEMTIPSFFKQEIISIEEKQLKQKETFQFREEFEQTAQKVVELKNKLKEAYLEIEKYKSEVQKNKQREEVFQYSLQRIAEERDDLTLQLEELSENSELKKAEKKLKQFQIACAHLEEENFKLEEENRKYCQLNEKLQLNDQTNTATIFALKSALKDLDTTNRAHLQRKIIHSLFMQKLKELEEIASQLQVLDTRMNLLVQHVSPNRSKQPFRAYCEYIWKKAILPAEKIHQLLLLHQKPPENLTLQDQSDNITLSLEILCWLDTQIQQIKKMSMLCNQFINSIPLDKLNQLPQQLDSEAVILFFKEADQEEAKPIREESPPFWNPYFPEPTPTSLDKFEPKKVNLEFQDSLSTVIPLEEFFSRLQAKVVQLSASSKFIQNQFKNLTR